MLKINDLYQDDIEKISAAIRGPKEDAVSTSLSNCLNTFKMKIMIGIATLGHKKLQCLS